MPSLFSIAFWVAGKLTSKSWPVEVRLVELSQSGLCHHTFSQHVRCLHCAISLKFKGITITLQAPLKDAAHMPIKSYIIIPSASSDEAGVLRWQLAQSSSSVYLPAVLYSSSISFASQEVLASSFNAIRSRTKFCLLSVVWRLAISCAAFWPLVVCALINSWL